MKASGHLFALAKILDYVQGITDFNGLYDKLNNKESLSELRRDNRGNFQYKTFLKEKIEKAVKEKKANNVNPETVIDKLGDLKSLFFSVKDFKENINDFFNSTYFNYCKLLC